MPRPLADALTHILDNIRQIETCTTGRQEAELRTNPMLADAVERCIERISEASRSIPESVKAGYPTEPWRDIATIGNILRHNYDAVDPHILWSLLTNDLPSLRHPVEAIAASRPES